MNQLVEEIIKPILEANSKIKKVVGIYGGRFQPFGPHHLKTYKWLERQVDEAYITTSNIKKPPRHPMNFKEKVRHMSKMGVPSNRIIEEKSPYVAKNLAKKFDKETTAFVYVFGKKDAGRLSGGKYFQDYKKNKNNLSGHEEHGYYLVAPHVSISVGGQEVSGTSMRELLGSSKIDDKERVKLFKKMFGYYDKGIFNMLTNKFKKLFEDTWVFKPTKMKKLKPKFKDGKDKELLKGQMKENVSAGQLAQVEKYLDKLWGKVGIDVEFTRHFLDRVNDKRNDKPISSAEVIKIFRQTYKKYGKQIAKLGKNAQAVMKDMKTDVNVPFVLKWDGKEFDMIAKTIMRKKNFKSSNKKFAVEGVDLPIEIGDTVRMGKFKNKKVVIKTIDWNEKGDLLINGRPAMKFRLEKKAEVEEDVNVVKKGGKDGGDYRDYDSESDSDWEEPYKQNEETIGHGYPNKEDMKKIRKRVNKARSKSDSSKEYQYNKIKEFLTTIDMKKIIDEGSTTTSSGKGVVDDGPSAFMYGMGGYGGRNKEWAEKLGWEVVNYILDVDVTKIPPFKDEFGGGKSVTPLPAGIGTGTTPNNPENLTGAKGYNKWVRNMKKVAQNVGFKLIDFMDKDEKEAKKQISKDTTQTLKQQKKDEKEKVESMGESFSKDWWDGIINEVSAKTRLFKQKLMRRGIKIRYDKEKAKEDLMKKYGGQGEIVGKKFGLRKAYYAVPKKGFKKDSKPTVKINKKEMEKLHKDKVLDKGNLKVVFSEIWWKEQLLLTEGGAYGHMAHPFDDKDLTFGDLKKIIESGLGGNLSREDNVTEKLDGQNIMISWKDGQLIAARNKGHIKDGGKNALTTKGIASKFAGRGDIADAFNFAMKDLERAIKGLSQKQKDKIFDNGHNFMNMEVMWPKSANVIDYDKAELVFHGALKYDDSGTVKGEVKGSGRILAGMIKQVNMHIGKKYKIGKPVFLEVPKHQDFGAKKDKFIGKLNKLKSQYGLKDNDTLALYHQSYWEEYIYNAAQQFGYKIPNNILKNLTKRWAFFDKSYKIPKIRKDLKKQPKFLEWVLSTDKNNHSKMVKENMKPFETLFFEVGAEILKNVKGFMAANPNKSVQGIRKKLKTAIAGVKAGGDKKKLNTLKLQLDKLNAIGGVDSIVPSEGIVFKYKGKTYKFTGAFAPINQIAGLINF
jgi:hypothetical protein